MGSDERSAANDDAGLAASGAYNPEGCATMLRRCVVRALKIRCAVPRSGDQLSGSSAAEAFSSSDCGKKSVGIHRLELHDDGFLP